jgi:hypothetical protein
MGKNYIKNGTPVGSQPLCKSCGNSHIMTGYRESECVTMCNEVNPSIVVPFLIYECSSYYDKNRPSWEQMQKLAINVSPRPRKKLGFKVGAGFGNAAAACTRAEKSDNNDGD